MKLKTLLILPLLVASLQAASVSDLTFTLINSGTEYSVSGCLNSASGSLNIPSTFGGEDTDGDGNLDVPEDLNADGLLNNGGTGAPLVAGGPNTLLAGEGSLLTEDTNNNGVLDAFEDLNYDGILNNGGTGAPAVPGGPNTFLVNGVNGATVNEGPLLTEDVNNNGVLDYFNEDLNADGILNNGGSGAPVGGRDFPPW